MESLCEAFKSLVAGIHFVCHWVTWVGAMDAGVAWVGPIKMQHGMHLSTLYCKFGPGGLVGAGARPSTRQICQPAARYSCAVAHAAAVQTANWPSLCIVPGLGSTAA